MEDAFVNYKFFLNLFGIKREESAFSQFRFVVCMLIFTEYTLASVAGIFSPDANIVESCIALIAAGEAFLAFVKLLTLHAQRRELFEMFDALGRLPCYSVFVAHCTRVYVFVMTILVFSLPLLALNNFEGMKMPTSVMYPWSKQTSRGYWLAYGLSSVGLMVEGYMQSLFENLVVSLSTQLSSKLMQLCEGFEELGWDNEDLPDEAVKSNIISLIQEHLYILRLIECMKKISQRVYFVQLICATLFITSSLFSVSQLVSLVPGGLKFLPLLFVYFSQIFTFCWSGELIKTHASDLRFAVYSSNWIRMSVPNRKLLYTVRIFAQKDVELKGGHIFEMNLRIFGTAIQQAASYFMFLHQFVENK